MVQYSSHPALSSQASKKSTVAKDNSDYFSYNEARISSSVNNKRVRRDSSSYAFSNPLSASTNLLSSPTTSATKPLRSPYISSRPVPSPFPSKSAQDSRPSSPAQSVISMTLEDVFTQGDIIGEGATLQGETITLVSIGDTVTVRSDTPDYERPAKEFEVIRRLGAGSYAVVYLVCEVLYRPPQSDDDHAVGALELEDTTRARPKTVYGREYALKCLSKANLDEEALAAQMSEVTIHQSLHSHPNIVTLHRTLETPSFLLLLLEYVPGEDLFYFLEQARDHYEAESDGSAESSTCSSRTPPTPSLLSNMNPNQQLSRTRLRLISSMFSQMCDAVAACHDQHVYHRDIKPENFIVTDGWHTHEDGNLERKVVVKLTDFGLSTTDVESSDMDCGSAPYMSYECRNNVAPTYRPRAADVWSLGIVLINMLYHCNPWTDTAQGACSSFSDYLRAPVYFFMTRFAGMTKPVAEVLASRVFSILDDPEDDSKRISASGFGTWVRDLPDLLTDDPKPRRGHQRNISISSSTQGYPIAPSTPISHRPQSRQASASGSTAVRTPAIPSRSLSRAPSLGPAYEHPETHELSTVFDQVEIEEIETKDREEETDMVSETGTNSRSHSAHKRRKRGARKGKGTAGTPTTPKDETLTTLAVASQSLARELSKTSKYSGRSQQSALSQQTASTSTSGNSRRSRPYEPVSMYALPTALLSSAKPLAPLVPPTPAVPPAPVSAPAAPSASTSTRLPHKKSSKWKLSFGKASGTNLASPGDDGASVVSSTESVAPMSTTASNVKSLIMALEAPSPNSGSTTNLHAEISPTYRGRRGRGSPPRPPYRDVHTSRSPLPPRSPNRDRWDDMRSDRAISPNSMRSGRPVASSASSISSDNWRSSMSSSSTSNVGSSVFTRSSNSSVRSVSTAATSASSNSWRTNARSAYYPELPKNVKMMEGIPKELSELPRGQRLDPPRNKQRSRKPKELSLGTISERPPPLSVNDQRSPGFVGREAGASTADLNSALSSASSQGEGSEGPKKVQKGQINALAKMLSALRR